MGLTYRMYDEADEPALLRLWSEQSGWGQADLALKAHFLDDPHGRIEFVVAVDESTEEIVGMLGFIPRPVHVAGEEVMAVRLFAPILSESARSSLRLTNLFAHPVLAMYRRAGPLLRERGYQLIHAVPDPKWMFLLKRLPFVQGTKFPLWMLELDELGASRWDIAVECGPLGASDSELDRLWQDSAQLYGCCLARDPRTLRWKLGAQHHHVVAIRREGELIGIATAKDKPGQPWKWVICDLLSTEAEAALEASVFAVCQAAKDALPGRSGREKTPKVEILAAPVLQPSLAKTGFRTTKYDFGFLVHIIDDSLAKERVAPQNWYVSADD